MPTVILLGALDTKGAEYRYVRDRLHASGVNSILLDVGILGNPSVRPRRVRRSRRTRSKRRDRRSPCER